VRFLLINQFYPPDAAPTGVFLHDVARGLAAAGHEVGVLCSRRGYDGGGPYAAREITDGVVVRRLAGVAFGRSGIARSASALTFMSLVLPRVVARRKPDVVLTLTSPPYVGLLGALAARLRGVRHVHWAMDVYPDVLRAHGVRAPYAILRGLARWQMGATRLVIAPAPAMARRLAGRALPSTTIETVPLWSHEIDWDTDIGALRRELGWPEDRLVLLYSGNMGLGHRFDEMLEAARTLGPEGPAWIFAGGGPRRGELAAAVAVDPHGPLWLLPYASPAEHRSRCLAADVHLLSLRTSWDGLIVPSKLQAAFGVGRPAILVGSAAGEPGSWITESGGGWIVAEGDTAGLLRAVEQAGDATERMRRGRAALAFARERFSPERNVARMVDLLERA